MDPSASPRLAAALGRERIRLRSAAIAAGLAVCPCSLAVLLATGCNALSGIDDFAVESEGSADRSIGEGASPDEGAPSEGGDAGGLDATLEATQQQGEASSDAGSDAAAPIADGAGDARTADGGDGGCIVVVHSNGLGQSFSDCVPLGTHTQAQAVEACAAFTGNMAQCAKDPIGCAPGNTVCSSGFTSCACWKYSGGNVGHVSSSDASAPEAGLEGGAGACTCPSATSLTWN